MRRVLVCCDITSASRILPTLLGYGRSIYLSAFARTFQWDLREIRNSRLRCQAELPELPLSLGQVDRGQPRGKGYSRDG